MKISELIKKLEVLQTKHGDIDVMIETENGGTFEMYDPFFHEVEEDDEYPKSWQMPKGFKFIKLEG